MLLKDPQVIEPVLTDQEVAKGAQHLFAAVLKSPQLR